MIDLMIASSSAARRIRQMVSLEQPNLVLDADVTAILLDEREHRVIRLVVAPQELVPIEAFRLHDVDMEFPS
ncbi:hypothetical protein BE08_19395 [Sorangium cellulosum]|uniref:Uncharacterized protein n=1 Tax=Sorangium cellulosum TaxID=56 RepID=A0A150PGX8_SORCE|nr:hypothetical protein BE08_19395 [Sorangium cellulosum]